MRSERMGLRLYAIADEPICVLSNGSSTSLRFASRRRSVAILCAVAPKLASGASASMSILREYVCDVTGYAYSKPEIFVTSSSSCSTLSWSPSKSARKLACVPVVPLAPRKPMSSRARLRLRRSQRNSCAQSQRFRAWRYSGCANLEPECRPLANSGQLSRLEVREAERRQVAILPGKLRKTVNDDCELVDNECKGLADENQIRVALRPSAYYLLSERICGHALSNIARRSTKAIGLSVKSFSGRKLKRTG